MKRLLPCILLLYYCVQAQTPEDFNRVYSKTFLETSQKDFNKALEIADSLFQISETPIFKTKSLMLSASLYQQSGDLKKAIEYALKSEKIISKTDNFVWISRVYGFLASQYRLTGLFSQSQKYSDLALDAAHKIGDKELSQGTMGLIIQEMAFNEINQNNYSQAIRYLKSAQQYLDEISEDRDFLTAKNQQLIGSSYIQLRQYDSAMIHLNNALDAYGDNPENYVKGMIHKSIADVYLEENDWVEAKEHLEIAQRIADNSNYLELKKEVNSTSQKYFFKTQDIENLSHTTAKQDSVVAKIDQQKFSFLDDSFSEFNRKNLEIKEKVEAKNKLLLGAGFVFLVGLMTFFHYRKYQRSKIKKIQALLENFEEEEQEREPGGDPSETTFNLELACPKKEEVSDIESVKMMKEDTEIKLLKKLEKFEKTTLYTQKNISMSFLATYCDTNSKYLSYVINTHKKQDFNNYINELRINYIIRKLKSKPLYRKYKIATLAEEAGFSSQNKFSTIFKKVTSISPSTFIQYMENETVDK